MCGNQNDTIKIMSMDRKLLATVHFNDDGSYEIIPNDERYDYYEGKWDDDLDWDWETSWSLFLLTLKNMEEW